MSPHMPLQAIYQEIIQANTALSLYLCISHPLSPHLLSLASSLYPLVILYPFCERAFRWAWGRINTVWSIFAWHTAPVAAHGGGGGGGERERDWQTRGGRRSALHTLGGGERGGGERPGMKEKCGDRVESNSQSSQRAPYLKVPPASFNGEPILPHRYEKARRLSIR